MGCSTNLETATASVAVATVALSKEVLQRPQAWPILARYAYCIYSQSYLQQAALSMSQAFSR